MMTCLLALSDSKATDISQDQITKKALLQVLVASSVPSGFGDDSQSTYSLGENMVCFVTHNFGESNAFLWSVSSWTFMAHVNLDRYTQRHAWCI